MFILLLQLVISQNSPPLNVGVIQALRPELQSLDTECSVSVPTLTKAVSDTNVYINSLSTVCSFDRETYITPLMDYQASYWNDAVANGGLSCKFVPECICDKVNTCSFQTGECQYAGATEPCSRIPAEVGLQQFRTAIAMTELLFDNGYGDIAQSILIQIRSALNQVELTSEMCPSTEATNSLTFSMPEGSGFRSGSDEFESIVESELDLPSKALDDDICAPGGVAAANTWCWDDRYTCDSCCNTDYTVGPNPRPCWTASFPKSSCCGSQ